MNITKENFQRIIVRLNESDKSLSCLSVNVGGVDGCFIFGKLTKRPFPYSFRFAALFNTYQEHCCFDNVDFTFEFKTYDDLIEIFKRLETRIQGAVCQFHTFHGPYDICPALFETTLREKCGICLQERPINHFQRTQCGHLFCLPCLNQWAKHEYIQELKNERLDEEVDVFRCPMCRANLQWCTECYSATFECTC